MRTQLAIPSNTFLSPDTYNQIFTMHGTVMMFLFAVPAVEAMGILLLPQMLGARDLPFPRLGAFAFWAYFVGGLVFFCTLFFDLAPSGGWFMYPPLTSTRYSPGIGADFWLLGIGFIEISAIAGAIEIIVGILRTRAPGMSLDKMPMFAWTMLIFAAMIVFAFPAVILATMMLELERAFGWPFFVAAKGGDALLWQHLFWFFGHPEVYIIFLPAAGMVSMIVASMARTPLVAYNLIVVALIATGFFSFGLWVHHMFTTGIPVMSLSFFSAASMAVAIPSGIQVFAWIATIASGKLRLATPALFVLGFLFIFTLGGLTGVMVAMVPFDWQVHDTYFVVAHLHYVLIGGMVFPLFAALYYWAPALSSRALSETLGRWAFWLMFLGFNIAFLPMHLLGLWGMPRRVYTYPAEMGWQTLNLIATAGAFTLAAGILVFLWDLVRNLRPIAHRARRQRLEGRHAGVAAQRSLRPAQHSAHRKPLPALAAAEPGTRRRGRALLSAQCTDRRARNHHHLSHRGRAAVSAAAARPRLDAVPRRDLHRRLFHAADGEAGRGGGGVRRPRHRFHSRVDLGQRPRTPGRRRHRRRHQAADLRHAARCRTRGGPWSFSCWSPARSTWPSSSPTSTSGRWRRRPGRPAATRDFPHPRWPSQRLACSPSARRAPTLQARCSLDRGRASPR